MILSPKLENTLTNSMLANALRLDISDNVNRMSCKKFAIITNRADSIYYYTG